MGPTFLLIPLPPLPSSDRDPLYPGLKAWYSQFSEYLDTHPVSGQASSNSRFVSDALDVLIPCPLNLYLHLILELV